MNKNRIALLLVSILLCFFIPSCKQKPKGPAYTIKMRLAPGDNFRQDMDASVKTGFKMGSVDMGMNMDMNFNMKFEVLGDSAGLTRIKMTYEKAKFGMEFHGVPGANDAPTEAFDTVGKKIEGKSIVLLVNKKYEIEEVIGFNEMAYGDSLEMEVYDEQTKKMFSKEQLNSMMGIMFQVYPDKPVKVGESWEREALTGMAGLKMNMKNRYKLLEVKDNIATIQLRSSYKGKGKIEQTGMELEMDMDGEQKGTITIDLRTGYLKSADQTMDVDARANIMGQKIPYKVTGHTKMKGE